eukprot:2244265-Pyramimonas_sp.AAC.1
MPPFLTRWVRAAGICPLSSRDWCALLEYSALRGMLGGLAVDVQELSPDPPKVSEAKGAGTVDNELPRTSIARAFMEAEKPCAKDECEPASGSFFKAAEMEVSAD